jgi:tRNA nucleotidyltransferase (CCA-adding enzyme)
VPPFVTALLAKADELALASQAPQPILQGRHLLQFGMTPGPKMGVLLQAAFQAQLDGEFQDLSGAQAWLVHQLKVTVAGEG